MDLDGDGIEDVVTGSYSPGDLYFFRGLGKGEFARGVSLLGTGGKPLRAGLASAATIADWHQDGKPDLVVGNIRGQVWLLRNRSHDGQLAFGPMEGLLARTQLVETTHDAGPLVVDWDGDGVPDVLLGSGDGSVTFFKGHRTQGVPDLGDGVVLIPKCPTTGSLLQSVDPATGELLVPPLDRPSIRTKLAVYDWNGDGKLDLIVGDAVSMVGPEPLLTSEQKAERDDLDTQRDEIGHQIRQIVDDADGRARLQLKAEHRTEDLSDEEELARRRNEILEQNQSYGELHARLDSVQKRLEPLRAKFSTHGFVWVYLRAGDPHSPSTAPPPR